MTLAVCTLGLIALGGNVTSRDAGLAVPDGFTVFGHFLWTFPLDQWVGNIFHEHVHRVFASIVGLMCIGLVIWLFAAERRRSVRWLGIGVLAGVVLQGIMGGLRVEMVTHWPAIATPLAITHGIVGQLFFALTVIVAAVTSGWWFISGKSTASTEPAPQGSRGLRRLSLIVLAVILLQLVLGSITRHTGAGLAIPDFPSSYGRLVPPMSQAAIDAAIDELPYDQVHTYFTAGQVHAHFAHRVGALIVTLVIGFYLARLGRVAADDARLRWPMAALGALLIVQLALGAMVIWSGRSPTITTGHQTSGAAILGVATLLALMLHRHPPAVPSPRTNDHPHAMPLRWREAPQP